MPASPIPIGGDYYALLSGAQDSGDGSFLNSATVTFALYTAAGVAVPGASGTASYVAASNGNYRGTIESTATVTLTVGARYQIRFVLTQGSIDFPFSEWTTAVTPGPSLVDSTSYQLATGKTYTGTELASLQFWCGVVSRGLQSALRPFRFEPVTLTNQIYDAPTDPLLTLRVRPVRAITSVYFRSDANGLVSRFTSNYLLDNTDGAEYMLDVDDDLEGIALKGGVLRTNQIWGGMWWQPPLRLGSRFTSQPKCVMVSYEAGFVSVPDDVQGAAVHLVTKMLNSRKFGAQVASASLNSASYSLPQNALGNIWDEGIVSDLLRRYKSVFVG